MVPDLKAFLKLSRKVLAIIKCILSDSKYDIELNVIRIRARNPFMLFATRSALLVRTITKKIKENRILIVESIK